MSAAHGQSIQRSEDRVRHHPGLVRQEHKGQTDLPQGQAQVRPHAAQVVDHRHQTPVRQNIHHYGKERWNHDRRKKEADPDPQRCSSDGPGTEKRQERARDR
jgi:hypothetical protein